MPNQSLFHFPIVHIFIFPKLINFQQILPNQPTLAWNYLCYSQGGSCPNSLWRRIQWREAIFMVEFIVAGAISLTVPGEYCNLEFPSHCRPTRETRPPPHCSGWPRMNIMQSVVMFYRCCPESVCGFCFFFFSLRGHQQQPRLKDWWTNCEALGHL